MNVKTLFGCFIDRAERCLDEGVKTALEVILGLRPVEAVEAIL